MDTATNLLEIIRIDDKKSVNIAQQFTNTWLSRYPQQINAIHNNGGEFIGHEFQEMLQEFEITAKPKIVIKNPQSNSIVEQLPKRMADIICVIMLYAIRLATTQSTGNFKMHCKSYHENFTRSNGVQQRHDDKRTVNIKSNSDWKTETPTCR